MQISRKWNFGIGTVFSLIVVYFIYLYAKDKGWVILAFLSKWYLIIIGSLIALSLGIILLVVLFSLLMFLIALVKFKKINKTYNRKKTKEFVDVEYKIKE